MSKRTDAAKKIANLVRKAADKKDPEAEGNVWERIGELIHQAVNDGEDATIDRALHLCDGSCPDSVSQLEDEVEYASCSIALRPLEENKDAEDLSAFLFAVPIVYLDAEPPPEIIPWRNADAAATAFRLSGLFDEHGSVILYPRLYPLESLLMSFSTAKRLLLSILATWPSERDSAKTDINATFEAIPQEPAGVTIYDGKTSIISLRFLLGVSVQNSVVLVDETRGFSKRVSAWESKFRDNLEAPAQRKIVSVLPPDMLFTAASRGVATFRSAGLEATICAVKGSRKKIERAVVAAAGDELVVELLDSEGRRIDECDIGLLAFRHSEMREELADGLAQVAEQNDIELDFS